MGDMILPKGIVTNTSWIYEEVAKFPVVPPDQIQKYWRVYTTTFTRLVDPTANRLENFWWHVWGSDRRELPGPVLARIFEEISNGPTFVRLRSTANRYEGPSQPPSPKSSKAAPVSDVVIKSKMLCEDGDTSSSSATVPPSTQEPDLEKKVSSAQQPPAKPILKKPRGPSSSGPRPVARFVSPAVSDSEELASSASTAVNETKDSKDLAPSKPRLEKKRAGPVTPKKKGSKVVALTASRRRPAMPKRASSQSSAGGSENGPKESKESSSISSKISSSARSIEPIAEGTIASTPDDSMESKEQLSAKAAGKRPVVSTPPAVFAKRPTSEAIAEPAVQIKKTPSYSESTASFPQIAGMKPSHVTNEGALVDIDKSMPVVESISRRTSEAPGRPSPMGGTGMSRSRSDMGASRPGIRDWNMNRRGLSQGLVSTSTVTTSTATAQGTIIEFDENLAANEACQNALQAQDDPIVGIQRSGTGSSTSSRLVPTQPVVTPAVHLGRSKSQLTLLLEKQGSEKKARR